jgi:hypothetical protein
MTLSGINAAFARTRIAGVTYALNDDPEERQAFATAEGLVTSNELLIGLGLRQLRAMAPKLRWVHIIGAGIEPLLPGVCRRSRPTNAPATGSRSSPTASPARRR